MAKIMVIYCSTSLFKKEEWKVVGSHCELHDSSGRQLPINELFDVRFRGVPLREPLLCDLKAVVREKAISAYEAVRVPCIVEHAGLIFDHLATHNYPGGLTQPMWDALQAEGFVAMKGVAGARVTARAIVGYCDGMSVHLFEGETHGSISEQPRGRREFYWDTVFCPDGGGGRTYAEIADGHDGMVAKMKLSQSQKALLEFLSFRLSHGPTLFL